MNIDPVLEKIAVKFQKIKENFSKVKYKTFIPRIYIAIVILGFVLVGLQTTFFQKLVICTSIFGGGTCDAIGNFVVTFASLPGYLIVSALLYFFPNIPNYFSFLAIFVISLLLYYLLGLAIDRQKIKPVKIFTTEFLVIILFVVLLLTFILLI